VSALHEIYEYVVGEALRGEPPQRASIWTDTNVYNEMGIPAVKIGPRGKRIGPRREEIDVEEMVRAAKIYALAALDVCSRPRSSRDAG
jgi:acetylornithine deacetylase/succinyl-diaminopimelate desuccinylase-like protein